MTRCTIFRSDAVVFFGRIPLIGRLKGRSDERRSVALPLNTFGGKDQGKRPLPMTHTETGYTAGAMNMLSVGRGSRGDRCNYWSRARGGYRISPRGGQDF